LKISKPLGVRRPWRPRTRYRLFEDGGSQISDQEFGRRFIPRRNVKETMDLVSSAKQRDIKD
jgi:hypothetical protein